MKKRNNNSPSSTSPTTMSRSGGGGSSPLRVTSPSSLSSSPSSSTSSASMYGRSQSARRLLSASSPDVHHHHHHQGHGGGGGSSLLKLSAGSTRVLASEGRGRTRTKPDDGVGRSRLTSSQAPEEAKQGNDSNNDKKKTTTTDKKKKQEKTEKTEEGGKEIERRKKNNYDEFEEETGGERKGDKERQKKKKTVTMMEAGQAQQQRADSKLKRTLSQRSQRSLNRKKYLARAPGGRSVASAVSSARSYRMVADEVRVESMPPIPVVFQWPKSGTEISVLFRASGATEWEEYTMYGDSNKGYRLMALLDPSIYHFKFWADGVYYQHPGCPLPNAFPDDFTVAFNLQVVCKQINPEHVKKLMLKYATKTWVRCAHKLGFGPKSSPDSSSSRNLSQLSLRVPQMEEKNDKKKKKRRTFASKSGAGSKSKQETSKRSSLSRKKQGSTIEVTNKAKGSPSQARRELRKEPSLCEEEDIDTASTISDSDNDTRGDREDEPVLEIKNSHIDSCKDQKDDDHDGDREDQQDDFYSDSSYYSSSDESDTSDDEQYGDGGDDFVRSPQHREEQERIKKVRPIEEAQSSDTEDENELPAHVDKPAARVPIARARTATGQQNEEDKDKKRQKMKRGPLVRLHPKAVIPATFYWNGPAKSVKLMYKLYFKPKWKSKSMQQAADSPSSKWSVRISLLPGIYRTCYLVDNERYYASPTHLISSPQRLLRESNLYRIDIDIKPWLEDTEKCGLLIKQGGRIKTWKQRYTVLRGHTLSYFKDAQEKEPINTLQLSQANGEIEASRLTNKDRACFKVNMPGRTYVFSSSSQAEVEEWVRCIKRSAFVHKNWERALSHFRPAPATYHNTV